VREKEPPREREGERERERERERRRETGQEKIKRPANMCREEEGKERGGGRTG